MGASQATIRAAKFSGNRTANDQQRSSTTTSCTTTSMLRRTSSNVNRNCKEFSQYWTAGGSLQPKRSASQSRHIRRRHSSITRSTYAAPTSPSSMSTSTNMIPHCNSIGSKRAEQLETYVLLSKQQEIHNGKQSVNTNHQRISQYEQQLNGLQRSVAVNHHRYGTTTRR